LYNHFLTTFWQLSLSYSHYLFILSSFFSLYYFWPVKGEKTKVVIKVVPKSCTNITNQFKICLWTCFPACVRLYYLETPRCCKKKIILKSAPFHYNFSDNLVFLSSYWSKIMEREKGRERIRTSCEYERESCTKVLTKWLYKYHFSIKKLISYHKSSVKGGQLVNILSFLFH